jgi:hypothetical protein
MCDRLFSSTLDADWTNLTNSLTWVLLDHVEWTIAVLEELRLISAKLMALPYKKLACII